MGRFTRSLTSSRPARDRPEVPDKEGAFLRQKVIGVFLANIRSDPSMGIRTWLAGSTPTRDELVSDADTSARRRAPEGERTSTGARGDLAARPASATVGGSDRD